MKVTQLNSPEVPLVVNLEMSRKEAVVLCNLLCCGFSWDDAERRGYGTLDSWEALHEVLFEFTRGVETPFKPTTSEPFKFKQEE